MSLSFSNAVRKIRSPTTMGEDAPGGTATFHNRFSFRPNFTGGFWSSATPEPPGPRNCVQSAPNTSDVKMSATKQPRYRIKVDSRLLMRRGNLAKQKDL